MRTHGLPVVTRRDDGPRGRGEPHGAHTQLVGHAVEEGLRRASRCVHAARLDVGRQHGAGGVGDEHDAGALHGYGDGRVRARERQCERDQCKGGHGSGDVTSPERGRRDGTGEDRHAGEARAVAPRAPPHPRVHRRERGQGRDRQQHEWGGEAHRNRRPSCSSQGSPVVRFTISAPAVRSPSRTAPRRCCSRSA